MMLTRRTIQSRLPKSGLVSSVGLHRVSFACHLNWRNSRLCLQLNGQQFRHYLFLPVSWDEARERFDRWLERTESRIVKVSLLKRRGERILPEDSDLQQKRRRSKNLTKKQRPYAVDQPQASLPLPSSRLAVTPSRSTKINNVYQSWKIQRKSQYQLWKDVREEQYLGWKSRRQAQYQGWKFRRQAQYQRWKSRRQAQYQKWSTQRNQEWIKRRQVILEEYSKSEWFDSLGRPLTARDSTGRFVNPWQSQSTNGVISLGILLRWRWQRFVRENMNLFSKFILPKMKSDRMTSSPLLTQTIPPLPVPERSNFHLTWIGHSTCLFQVQKQFSILTDPIFSTRASPYKNFIGVPRDVPPAFSIEELVMHQTRNNVMNGINGTEGEQDCNIKKLDLCCITHDHYDHMDKQSVKELKHHVQLWVVPLGIGDWLVEKCSISRKRIVELQWWQQVLVGKKEGRVVVLKSDNNDDRAFVGDDYNDSEVLTITCCPSSHWAGRTMFDRNLRLWCSFAFSASSFKFFVCGDSGYPSFPLFRQIGDTLGPFDLSCIPIGAYEPRELNKDAHCDPQEAVKIHKDLQSKHSVAIHWGSFQLAEESMGAPPQELEDAICAENRRQLVSESALPVTFSVLGHGETLEKRINKSPLGTITSLNLSNDST